MTMQHLIGSWRSHMCGINFITNMLGLRGLLSIVKCALIIFSIDFETLTIISCGFTSLSLLFGLLLGLHLIQESHPPPPDLLWVLGGPPGSPPPAPEGVSGALRDLGSWGGGLGGTSGATGSSLGGP